MANLTKIVLGASLIVTGSFVACVSLASRAAEVMSAGVTSFSSLNVGATIKGWTVQTFRGVKQASTYALVRDEQANAVVVEGTANASAAALAQRVDADARATPVLRYSWKVGNLIERSNPREKAGDDYAARLYVTFANDPARESFRERAENAIAQALYKETPPHAALTYVFTHKAARGDIITSPYTSRARMIVVDADPASVGQWKSFTRDVYEDYKRAFGEEPTRISGIAIMVDADNTGDKASARFGDISLTAKP
jgi:Protein of unknown function (DUF3047)